MAWMLHHGVTYKPTRFALLSIAVTCGALGASLNAGCGGDGPAKALDDPPKVLANTELAVSDRVEAVDAIWQRRLSVSKSDAREAMKNIVWSSRYPLGVRQHATELLLSDKDDIDNADTRNSLALRLPTEASPDMIGYICRLAGERNWTEFAQPAIRSWSRRITGFGDDVRPERLLLEKLSGKPATAAVFELFATSVGSGPKLTAAETDRTEKSRRAAWEVLTRLDPTGKERTALLASLSPAAAADPLIGDIRSSAADLGCVPVTDSELEQLAAMRRFDDKADGSARRRWWAEATVAVSGLKPEQRIGLRLRHTEPIRWCAANRTEWMGKDRAGLLALIAERLKGRTPYTRSGPSSTAVVTSDESLSSNGPSLVWGDCLAILTIDDALSTAGVSASLWEQAERDIKDTSTEYGGLLETSGNGHSRAFIVTLYAPRPTQRAGDQKFIASDDMMRAGTWALAHYHFHAQRSNNAEYAGPGPGDEEFATEHGKNCLVFTPVKEGAFNVDYFISGGTKLDLGVLNRDGTRR